MTVVVIVSGGLLAIGAVMALARMERGPTVLDRMAALDVVTSVLIIGVALEAAVNRRTDTLPIMAALALVGFLAPVAIARFVSVEPEDAGRIKTAEEVRAEDDIRRRIEEAQALREAEEAARRDDEVAE